MDGLECGSDDLGEGLGVGGAGEVEADGLEGSDGFFDLGESAVADGLADGVGVDGGLADCFELLVGGLGLGGSEVEDDEGFGGEPPAGRGLGGGIFAGGFGVHVGMVAVFGF